MECSVIKITQLSLDEYDDNFQCQPYSIRKLYDSRIPFCCPCMLKELQLRLIFRKVIFPIRKNNGLLIKYSYLSYQLLNQPQKESTVPHK